MEWWEDESLRVTTIVFGAGASFDCLPKHSPDLPPLTAGLTDDDLLFELAPNCRHLLMAVDAARITMDSRSFDFEQELHRLYEQHKDDPQWAPRFESLAYGLAARMGRPAATIGSAPTRTAYERLYSTMSSGPNSRRRLLLMINMNYDTLAQQALGQDRDLLASEEYLGSQDRPEIITHPHGCAAWLEGEHGSEIVLQARPPNALSPDWNFPGPPRIALPMRDEAKLNLMWPTTHEAAVDFLLPRSQHVIVIGWQGADKQIADRLRKCAPEVAHVVAKSTKDAEEIAEGLNLHYWQSSRISKEYFGKFHAGFWDYVTNPDSPLFSLFPR